MLCIIVAAGREQMSNTPAYRLTPNVGDVRAAQNFKTPDSRQCSETIESETISLHSSENLTHTREPRQ